MSIAGERVVAVASRYLGMSESPPGSNRGPLIDRWEARWGLRSQPWCGMALAAWYAEAGVDDAGLTHPSTAEMCRRARDKRAVWDGHTDIPTGAIWVACGVHTALVVHDQGRGVVSTIEANHGDAVAMGVRSAADGLIVIPPAVLADVPPPAPPGPLTRYWIEDPAARPRLFGPWGERAARARALATIPAARRARVRLVRGASGGYGWVEGPRRLYGPWGSRDARDAAAASLEKHLGHPLRRFSKTVHA